MSTLKQETLNRNVNGEAVAAYVQGLKKQREDLEIRAWPNDPTEREATAITALQRAEAAMSLGLELAQEADRMATTLAYDRLYGREVA